MGEPARRVLTEVSCGYIPLGFWLTKKHPELRGAARTVYMAIGQFANAGNLSPSKRELRMATGLCENSVDAAVSELRRSGWVMIGHERGGPNEYRLMRGPWLDAPPVIDPTPPQEDSTTPPSHWGGIKGSEKSSEKQHATGPALSSLPASPPLPAPLAAVSSQAPAPRAEKPRAPLSELTTRRLWREYPDHAAAILAVLAKPAHVDDPALCEHSVSKLLTSREAIGSPVGYVARVLSGELVARAIAPPPPEPAPRPRPAAPPDDPLRNRVAALAARLSTCPATMPAHGPVREGEPLLKATSAARVKLEQQLAEARAALELRNVQPEDPPR
jgi:hypothetical protein